jgi:hypothetical protein
MITKITDPEGVKPPYIKQAPIIRNPEGVEFLKKKQS